MTVTGILSAILVGIVIGYLGRLVAPGRQKLSVWMTIAIGVIAALLGSVVVGSLRDTSGVDWIELIVQVVLAAIGVSLASSARNRRKGIWS